MHFEEEVLWFPDEALQALTLLEKGRPTGWNTLIWLFIILCTHTDLGVLCAALYLYPPPKVLPHSFSCSSEMSGQIVSDYFLQLLPPSSTTLKIIHSKGNFKKAFVWKFPPSNWVHCTEIKALLSVGLGRQEFSEQTPSFWCRMGQNDLWFFPLPHS